jgi:hypothetical protein
MTAVIFRRAPRLLNVAGGQEMDGPMHEQDDAPSSARVIILAAGGAALAALVVALLRRKGDEEPEEKIEAAVEGIKKDAKKAAKAAKKKQKEMARAAAKAGDRVGVEVSEVASHLGFDAKAAERDLKAAAWDAQQEAREAESRLRAAGHRVVDDASNLASRVGAEARHLAGGGKERFAHLRHRADAEHPAERELERLREEIAELRAQLAGTGQHAGRDLARRLGGKSRASKEAMASEAAAAAFSQFEKSLRAKAPALLAAKNRAQVMEILQQELGPTLRDSAVQAAAAALGMWETARERGETMDSVRERAREFAEDVRATAHDVSDEARHVAHDASDESAQFIEAARANGKRRFWRGRHGDDLAEAARDLVDEAAHLTDGEEHEEARRGKAGLFWGGAGLGLALYALLDAERREKVLHLANEASIQVQELVRDLQGYDDEF